MNSFTVVSEKPIAKGIRRIFAVTGAEAAAAVARGEAIQAEADAITAQIEGGKYEYSKIISQVNTLIQSNDKSVIPAWRRDRIRDHVSGIKAKLDKAKNEAEKGLATENAAEIASLIAKHKDAPVIVEVLKTKGTSKGISEGLKTMRKKAPETAAVIIAVNDDDVYFHCLVPKKLSSGLGLKADEWLGTFSGMMGAKCGGKDLYAQGSGKGASQVEKALNLAKQYADSKMK